MTMIETTSVFKVGEKLFTTFESAQLESLNALFLSMTPETMSNGAAGISGFLLDHKDEFVSVLTMNEPKKPSRKPRSDAGKTHAKKKAKAAQEPSEPFGPGVKIEASEKYAGT